MRKTRKKHSFKKKFFHERQHKKNAAEKYKKKCWNKKHLKKKRKIQLKTPYLMKKKEKQNSVFYGKNYAFFLFHRKMEKFHQSRYYICWVVLKFVGKVFNITFWILLSTRRLHLRSILLKFIFFSNKENWEAFTKYRVSPLSPDTKNSTGKWNTQKSPTKFHSKKQKLFQLHKSIQQFFFLKWNNFPPNKKNN